MNSLQKIVSASLVISFFLTACAQPSPTPTEPVISSPTLAPTKTDIPPTAIPSPTKPLSLADIIFYKILLANSRRASVEPARVVLFRLVFGFVTQLQIMKCIGWQFSWFLEQ